MTPYPKNGFTENLEPATSNPYKYYNAYDELRPKNEPRFLQKIRDIEKSMGFLTPLIWKNIIFFFLSHTILITWLAYVVFVGKFEPKWQSWIQWIILYIMGTFGVTGGAHRYWSHRSFKAEWPLRCILMFCFILSGQTSILTWVRDHRVHHKFSETIADPHDAKRGFFFAHMGWLMMKKHPAVIREGQKLDLSDITSDPLARFQIKYFPWLKICISLVVPCVMPPLLWGESWELAILIHYFQLLILGTHAVFSVNSFAHTFGNRPYDPNINPSENFLVSTVTFGEGWHNYHHTFPWDYKAAELPYFMNLTTMLVECFAALGWAHHLKKASPELIKSVVKNRGGNY